MTNTADIGIAATVEEEFDRQLANLVAKGYAELAGMSPEELVGHVEPLRDYLPKVSVSDESAIPFVIVVRSKLVPTALAVERVEVRGRAGWTDMHDELAGYRPIDGVDVPGSPVYLLTDVDTGEGTLGVRPNDALPLILGSGRTPLTIDEGVALLTQLPAILEVRNAFQALGSRTGNKRIPSFWVSKGAPRLGWCWAGNPHSWLGAASATARYGSE